MTTIKEHTDSIQFLKGRISVLKQQISKAKKTGSSIDNSIEILELQYEVEQNETALNIVKASWQIEFNKLDPQCNQELQDVLNFLNSFIEISSETILEMIEEFENDEEVLIDMDEHESTIESLEYRIAIYRKILNVLKTNIKEIV